MRRRWRKRHRGQSSSIAPRRAGGTRARWSAPLVAGLAVAWLIPAMAQMAQMAPPQDISPEAQAFYRTLRPRPAAAIDYASAETMQRLRGGLAQMFLGNARKITTDYRLEPVASGGVTSYWVRQGKPRHARKAILYLHGGGYILGSATANLGVPLRVGPAAGTPVLSVEYRLAPEHPFPAALDDCLAAYGWLLKQGYRGKDVAFMGDSAGGGLAVSCALATRDRKLPLPAAVAALSPLTDLAALSDTRLTLAPYELLDSGDPKPRYALYAGRHDVHEPLVSPVYADFRGFPPLLIQVGTREVLLGDAVRLARRAREAGVEVTLDVWDGMWHVWQDHPTAPEARAASEEIGRFIESRLTGRRAG